MRKLLIFLLLATSCFAGTTTLTGVIRDEQGAPLNGKLLMYLPVPAQDPATNTAIAPIPVTFRLVNGNITGGAPLYDVLTINPANLYYIARAYDTAGNLQFYGNFNVTGASFALGSAVPVNVTTNNISYSGVGFLALNNTWTGINSFKAISSINNAFYASQACSSPGSLNETCFNNIITSTACSSGGATNTSCKIIVDSGTYTLNNPVSTVPGACAAYPNNSCPVNIECTDRSVTINIVGNHDGFLIGQNSRIANCHIVGDNNGANTGQKCIDSGNAANVMIEGNFIEKCSGTGINTGGNMTNWTIRDNVIQNGLLEGMLIGTSGGGNTGCTITGNKVNGNSQNGIDLNASRCVVANNSLNNNGTAHVGGNSSNIIVFSSSTVTPVDNNVISNNTLSGAFERGIDLQCLGGSMQNNTVTGNTANGNSQDGIRLIYNSGTGTCKGNTILGNSLTNNTVNGLNEVAGGGGTYSGNVLGPNTYIGNGVSIAADMTGVQTIGLTQTSNIAGCTTVAAALWGTCTNTVTWPITYPTTGYKVGCTGNGTGAGVPVLGPIASKVVASINITTYEATAVNAAFTTVECVASQ